MRTRFCLAALAVVLLSCSARAHYNMLLPQKASAKKGEEMRFTYQWGHPFEHQLFDAPSPQSVLVLAPDGKKTDLTRRLERAQVPAGEGKKVIVYGFRFTPPERGDYVFVLQTPPIWMEEDGEFLQDTVKCVLHVQAQKGWEALHRLDFEFQPLTRPYSLLPGMVFQAQVQDLRIRRNAGGPSGIEVPEGPQALAPLAGALVEVERYNATPPRELPPDELITRTVRTDPNGVVTTTLTDPGWWVLTVARKAGMREYKDKQYPLRQRSSLWVFVEDKVAGR